jgi:PHD/YefM family antitoxin component YafN of YafNO toxin-antitoxin module
MHISSKELRAMTRYAREEIMSSSEVVRNFGAVLSSVVRHQREKVAIIRNNRLEAVLVAADVYERLEKAGETAAAASTAASNGTTGNSAVLLDFLRKNRITAASRLSPEEIDCQIREEREAWE